MYNASSLVSGLVTLGTPHVRLEDEQGRPRELPFSRNFKVTTSQRSRCGTPLSNDVLFFLYARTYDSLVVCFEKCVFGGICGVFSISAG